MRTITYSKPKVIIWNMEHNFGHGKKKLAPLLLTFGNSPPPFGVEENQKNYSLFYNFTEESKGKTIEVLLK